jgi:hypothetical protein
VGAIIAGEGGAPTPGAATDTGVVTGEGHRAWRRLDQPRNARRGHAQTRHSFAREAIALLLFAILIVVDLLQQERRAL